ncbi:MAG: FecR family protein [Methyloceanibacter sp.]|nr:FecR family protein [Methyloceanibacter sp.]
MVTNGQMTPRRGALAIALLLGASAGLVLSAPADAAKVGVAAAVNPDAFSSLSGVPNKQLNIGKSIFYNERIKTTANGLVQVLLVDGSTFTVGPNSNLVIDKFVYDPKKKTGEVVATFSKGSMRFIGGKLSKNAGGVKVNTPSGALAIRGGMFQGNTDRKIYSFLYGHSMTLRGRNGKVHTVYQPGYTLDLSNGFGNVRPTTAEDTAVFAKALSNRGGSSVTGNGGDGGGEGGSQGAQQQASANQAIQSVSVQDMISDATREAIATDIIEQIEELQKKEDPPPSNAPTSTPTNSPPPPPPEIDARVIHIDESGNLADFDQTFQVIDKRLVADIPAIASSELSDDHLGTRPSLQFDFPETLECIEGFCSVTDAQVIVGGEPVNYFGQAIVKPGFFGYHVISEGLAPPEQEALLSSSEQAPRGPSTLLVFGGKKYNFAPPSGKVYTFQLANDIVQGDAAPFASGASSAIGEGNAAVSPLYLKEQGAEGAPESNVWLQTSFAVGTGKDSEGQSFINVALGNWSSEEGLQGSRRGGSDLDRNNYSFSGDIASLSGPDGGHFLGNDDALPNAVLTLGGPGTEELGRDEALHDAEIILPIDFREVEGDFEGLQVSNVPDRPSEIPGGDGGTGSTYHLAAGFETPEDLTGDAASGQFKGYAAGFQQQANNRGSIRSLVNYSPDDVMLDLDSESNTVDASMRFQQFIPIRANGDIKVSKTYTYTFGGQGRSALINDDIFAALESMEPSAITETGKEIVDYETKKRLVGFNGWRPVFEEYQSPIRDRYEFSETLETKSYMISADAMGANEVLFKDQYAKGPEGETLMGPTGQPIQKRAFCQDCKYIKWGAWGTRSSYTDRRGRNVTEDTHLGWWITGDVVSPNDMPGAGDANYAGDVVGTVAKLKNGQWNQSVATGKLDAYWNFRHRAGTIDIRDFDNKNIHGVIGASKESPQNFVGGLGGKGGIVGTTAGSFVGSPGRGQTPGGIIGNFDARKLNGNWRANGIYGGTVVPPR